MTLTKEQGETILNDFRHYDGRKIIVKDGQIGEYPVVIMLPFDQDKNRECVLDIYERMRTQRPLIREYDFGDILYTVQVFFYDYIHNETIGKHTDLVKWLKTIDMKFDNIKYGIE